MEKPSFGKSLEEHLNISGREIAFPIEACVTMLLECGMQEEVNGTHIRTQIAAEMFLKIRTSLLIKCGRRSGGCFPITTFEMITLR